MSDTLFSVEGKRIFITGGASGVGRMMSEGLASRGARVFTCSRKQASLDGLLAAAGQNGWDVHATAGDVSDVGECKRLAAAATAHFGGAIDVLINNAGATWGGSLDEYPENGWDRCFDLNVKGLFFLTQQCLPALRAAASADDPARVINIGSISGIMHSLDDAWAYHPAKAAVHHLSAVLAKKLASEAITVNAVAPGLFPSKMTAFMMPGGDSSLVSQAIPMRRAGRPDDIVGTVVYLASRAGAFTTGALIKVDGGSAL